MEPPVVVYKESDPATEAEIGKLLEEDLLKCCGIRVFYYREEGGNCDHSEDHQGEWAEKMRDSSNLEAGTVISVGQYSVSSVTGPAEKFHTVVIQWDCGVKRAYTKEQLEKSYIRVFDLGPAGYKGEMMFCDKCLIPVMGFGWRLAKEEDSPGDLYDLCCRHYNENEDPYSDDRFYCNIPSGHIQSSGGEHTREKICPRSYARTYNLIGLFKDAEVKCDKFKSGRIVKINHKNKPKEDDVSQGKNAFSPQDDMRKADFYNCCAEIIPAPGKPLVYKSAGAKGMIEVQVTTPGKWEPGTIFAAHHPPLKFDLFREMSTCYDKNHCLHLKDGNFCSVRRENGKCYSLTISGTTLREVPDEVWDECGDLKIVILYMNNLTSLPSQLYKFRDTITLVCIQNNKFREIPQVLFKFTELEHLNMHGNFLSVIPEDFRSFTKLQRLYLSDNDLNSLPNIFDCFPLLEKASFSMNHLTRLPPSLASLESLVKLDISDNAIVKFPEPLLKLKSLKFLGIERNRIQRLTPPEKENAELYTSTYNFICQLKHLQLKGNPIMQHKCLEECIKDHSSILGCLKENFKDLSEIELTQSLRVNVLGRSGAGKTSLVQALVLEKYVIPTTQKEHRHTVGIDRYHLPVQIGGKTILLHIWDHAGDNEYAMMNDLFISDRSLVWIVVNLAEYNPSGVKRNQRVFFKYIGDWLLQVMSHNLKPIVWIICTHADVTAKSGISNARKIEHIKFWANDLCDEFAKSLSAAENEHREMPRVCCKHEDNLEEPSKAEVPMFLKENMNFIEVTNTFGFQGLKRIHDHLNEFADPSIWSSFLMTPLPIEWLEGMDKLQLYAEEEVNHLTSNHLPVISAEKASHVTAVTNVEDFLDYQRDVGEIYLMKEKGKYTAIINIDWIVSLLKEVYRHDFGDKLEEAKSDNDFRSVTDEVLDNAAHIREDSGQISESILRPLWKCNGKEKKELFGKIIKLFETFNLTFSAPDQDTRHFFPYLRNHKFPEEDDHQDHNVISLNYTFNCFHPRFYLQRLALKFWHDDKTSETKIYDQCFTTVLQGSIKLTVTHDADATERPYQDNLRICLHSNTGCNLDLWASVPVILRIMHEILSKYWKFHSYTKVLVLCPGCVKQKLANPNSLCLMQFSDQTYYSNFQSQKILSCMSCGSKNMRISELVPSTSHDFGESHHIFEIVCVENEHDFAKKLTQKWDLQSFSPEQMSLASYPSQGEDLFPISIDQGD